MLKYHVTVADFGRKPDAPRQLRPVSLAKAQRQADRAIRQGVKRFNPAKWEIQSPSGLASACLRHAAAERANIAYYRRLGMADVAAVCLARARQYLKNARAWTNDFEGELAKNAEWIAANPDAARKAGVLLNPSPPTLSRSQWGGHGGAFPDAYRSAVITLA